MPKVDVPQILISSAAIFGIGLLWYDFNKKVYETVFDLLEVTLCETAEEKARRIKEIEEEIRRKEEEKEALEKTDEFILNFCFYLYQPLSCQTTGLLRPSWTPLLSLA